MKAEKCIKSTLKKIFKIILYILLLEVGNSYFPSLQMGSYVQTDKAHLHKTFPVQ